jgi:uncharacterized Zn-binding protein involved in type VI secretion|tara:strand:- start:3951 stop:4241 length:291 start_codon:yes stop_codon:yes gene_type:complete
MPGRPISCLGDMNQVGGAIMRGAATTLVAGRPVGLHVSIMTPHAPWGTPHPPHAAAITTDGAPTVICSAAPVLRIGSGNSCGHAIITGCPTVMVGS